MGQKNDRIPRCRAMHPFTVDTAHERALKINEHIKAKHRFWGVSDPPQSLASIIQDAMEEPRMALMKINLCAQQPRVWCSARRLYRTDLLGLLPSGALVIAGSPLAPGNCLDYQAELL
jgi:hypothetical protein